MSSSGESGTEPVAEGGGFRQGAAGERLGPYVIVREVGRGGQAIVYEARDARMRRRVA